VQTLIETPADAVGFVAAALTFAAFVVLFVLAAVREVREAEPDGADPPVTDSPTQPLPRTDDGG